MAKQQEQPKETISPRPAKVRLTDKAKEQLATIYHFRKLDTFQVARLFYADDHYGRKTAQRRLRQLEKAGYLWHAEQASKPSEGRKPFVWGVDRQAVELLPEILDVEPEDIDWSPRERTTSDQHFEHLLKTNDVRIAIALACQQQGVEIVKWLDDKTLKSRQAKEYVTVVGPQGGTQKSAIVPDGYFHLHAPMLPAKVKEIHHFLEVDLATVTGQSSVFGRRDWVKKILTYTVYHKTGLYKKRYGANSYRMLTVTTSQRRLETLKRITEEVGGTTPFWFTTFEQLTYETVLMKPIWQVATKEGGYSLIW